MKKLHELTEKEFNILKKEGVLNSIYPDAPKNFEDVSGRKPKPLENPDFSGLKRQVEEHLDSIANKTDREDDDHYIYEAAVTAVFGNDVWTYINKQRR